MEKIQESEISPVTGQEINPEKTSPRPCEICKKVRFLKEFQDTTRTLKFEVCKVCHQRKTK